MPDPSILVAIRALALELSYEDNDLNRLGGLVALMCDAMQNQQLLEQRTLDKLVTLLEIQTIQLRRLHARLDEKETDERPAAAGPEPGDDPGRGA